MERPPLTLHSAFFIFFYDTFINFDDYRTKMTNVSQKKMKKADQRVSRWRSNQLFLFFSMILSSFSTYLHVRASRSGMRFQLLRLHARARERMQLPVERERGAWPQHVEAAGCDEGIHMPSQRKAIAFAKGKQCKAFCKGNCFSLRRHAAAFWKRKGSMAPAYVAVCGCVF